MATPSSVDIALLNPRVPNKNGASSLASQKPLLLRSEVNALVKKTCLLTPPLWSLRDMVAVNPFLGYVDQHFLEAHRRVKQRLGAHILPTIRDLALLFSQGIYNKSHLEKAIVEGKSNERLKASFTSEDLIEVIKEAQKDAPSVEVVERPFVTLAEWLDTQHKLPGRWKNDIIVDLSRFCSSYFDKGVSRLSYAQYREGFFSSWHLYATTSRAMYARGLKAFHRYVETLPLEVDSALYQMVNDLGIYDLPTLEEYFCSLLGELPGWGGFLRQRAWQKSQNESGELPELLAMRLAYEVALYKDPTTHSLVHKQVEQLRQTLLQKKRIVGAGSKEEIRYLLLRALELSYRETLLREFRSVNTDSVVIEPESSEGPIVSERSTAQVVLCIDVRSEIVRRHLSAVAPSVETYGFAGFFGLPIEVVEEGESKPHCPVLLQPQIQVYQEENSHGLGKKKIKEIGTGAKALLKYVSRSAHSCFTYVETVGFLSFFHLLKHLWEPLKSEDSGDSEKAHELTNRYVLSALPEQRKVELARGILQNLGLRTPYARLVLLCGHESHSANNPQLAGLACGACAGHSGAPNAQVAAALLNDDLVRQELVKVGWEIPHDTLFIAGIHNTVTDNISVISSVPSSHSNDLASLKEQINLTSELVRSERAAKLGLQEDEFSSRKLYSLLVQKSKDIAEVRPEWALAGNASFVAARAEQLRKVNFKGRSFLHNYNQSLDPEGAVLEMILTAPVVVASWINLQYFASSVDPEHFGSGLKTIHNISAGVGVVCGNDGDLAPGLSFHSVHDGEKLQHQPLRLQVFIQAQKESINRIVKKHSFLRDLIKNEWILLYSLNDSLGKCSRCRDEGKWEVIE